MISHQSEANVFSTEHTFLNANPAMLDKNGLFCSAKKTVSVVTELNDSAQKAANLMQHFRM